MDSDTKLMMKVKNDDEEAFMILFEKYSPRILGYLMRNGASRVEAEEIVQEAFLRVWSERRRFRPTGTFQAWLYTIASHILINERKRWSREITDEQQMLSHPEKSDNDPFYRVSLSQTVGRVKGVLEQMKQEYRMAVLLAAEGLSYQEAARAMGLSVSAYKTVLFRARGLLRSHFAEAGRKE